MSAGLSFDLSHQFIGLEGNSGSRYAYDNGLPAGGRIKNLGGRIHELRTHGWDIKTDVRNGVCWYVLIGRPVPTTKSLAL